MKHKTLFRLLIKAIGVLLIGFALPELIAVVTYFLLVQTPGSPGWVAPTQWMYSTIGPAAQIGIGAYLLLEGGWVVDRCIPSNRPYCPECGYDLSKAVSPNCPECGVALPASKQIT